MESPSRIAPEKAEAITAETDTFEKAAEAEVSLSDIESIPGAVITHHGDGTWTADISGERGVRALAEAHDDWVRAENERGLAASYKVRSVALKDASGREFSIPEPVLEDVVHKRGLVPFGRARWGKGKTLLVERKGKLYRNVDGELIPVGA